MSTDPTKVQIFGFQHGEPKALEKFLQRIRGYYRVASALIAVNKRTLAGWVVTFGPAPP
jgi:hypothetical protein